MKKVQSQCHLTISGSYLLWNLAMLLPELNTPFSALSQNQTLMSFIIATLHFWIYLKFILLLCVVPRMYAIIVHIMVLWNCTAQNWLLFKVPQVPIAAEHAPGVQSIFSNWTLYQNSSHTEVDILPALMVSRIQKA